MKTSDSFVILAFVAVITIGLMKFTFSHRESPVIAATVEPQLNALQNPVRPPPRSRREFNTNDDSAQESEAVEILKKYIPNPTEEQIIDAQRLVYAHKSFRASRMQEFEVLKASERAADNDEMIKVLGFQRIALVEMCKATSKDLYDADRDYMVRKGYSTNLFHELWLEAWPKPEPWE